MEEIYHWKSPSDPFTGEPLFIWRDLITEDLLAIPEADWTAAAKRAVAELQEYSGAAWSADDLWRWLSTSGAGFGNLPSFRLSGATIADRAFLCSAVAYSIAIDQDHLRDPHKIGALRLSAMLQELGEIAGAVQPFVSDQTLDPKYHKLRTEAAPLYSAITANLRDFVAISPKPQEGDVLSPQNVLYLADLVSSNRLKFETGKWLPPNPFSPTDIEASVGTIESAGSFLSHPLAGSVGNPLPRIGLILGGATRIKAYFLESARLPEIRGASALLDRINLEDVPALFGDSIRCSNKIRYEETRSRFAERTGEHMNAPECLIYANGGNTLAFAPASVAALLAQEIEDIYTRETLVANSCAVSGEFDLIELHYGLAPTGRWLSEFRAEASDHSLTEILDTLYRHPNKTSRPFAGLSSEERVQAFLQRKCFGELASSLATKQYRRREGNPDDDGRPSRAYPPHYEAIPLARRCSSCDRRPAIVEEPEDSERYLCAACGRKRLVGRLSKASDPGGRHPRAYDRLKASVNWPRGELWSHRVEDWIEKFTNFLHRNKDLGNRYFQKPGGDHSYQEGEIASAQDLAEIADDKGFVGLVYADGNNVGAIIERIAAAAQYGQFARRLFEANQEAVFTGLAEVLRPHRRLPSDERPKREVAHLLDEQGKILVHPFEILSIGGDDLMLFVPGEYALEIACRIARNLERPFQSHNRYVAELLNQSQRYRPDDYVQRAMSMQPAVSLSSGVVIADSHTPVSFMQELADQLLKLAKKYAKSLRNYGYSGGTVDFMALKSVTGITSKVGQFRRDTLEYRSGGETLKLYSRPYTVFELEGLLNTARTLSRQREFPRSQLYSLRNDAMDRDSGRWGSTLNYLYFRARARAQVARSIRDNFEIPWWGKSAELIHPWRRISGNGDEDSVYETLLYDLVEIYDFASGGE